MRISLIALTIAGGLAVSGCAYGSFGRYGGVSVGYGSGYGGYGYGGYGYPYRYGSLYGSPYWGWYDGFYYPGTGFYVYDRYRRPYVWSDRYRRYWSDRRDVWRQRAGTRDPSLQQAIWTSFSRHRERSGATVQRSSSVSDSDTAVRTETRRVRTERPRSNRSERSTVRPPREPQPD